MSSDVCQDLILQRASSNPLVIVVSGPSGVGKDAILNIMKDRNYPFEFIITMTTRRRRANEKHQIDYNFVSEDQFHGLLKNNGLLESANVYGNWYGVPRSPVREALEQGKDTIIKVDVQGAANIKKVLPEAVFIFIMPPSLQELSSRLTQRSTETTSDLTRRLETAQSELEQIGIFDYLVINPCDGIENAIQDILSIIKAEKCRVNRRKLVL